jgi:hypothetical protein
MIPGFLLCMGRVGIGQARHAKNIGLLQDIVHGLRIYQLTDEYYNSDLCKGAV